MSAGFKFHFAVGIATIETRDAMGFKALDNLDAHFAGRPLPAQVV